MMNYQEALKTLIWNLRLDFDPVGIRFVMDEAEIEKLPVTMKAKTKITYCQYLAAARQARYSLFMETDRLLCNNARGVFGFRELNEDVDTKEHLKYLRNPELAWQAPREKERLDVGTCKGIFTAPLDVYNHIEYEPSVVFMAVTPYQAYHILNEYMTATNVPNLTFFHTPNSAVCSGSVYAFNKHTANLTTMCAGSKTSGKTEMGYMNVFIPGDQILPTVESLANRVEETGGPSLLGQGGQSWPGLDACKGCPLFKFEKV